MTFDIPSQHSEPVRSETYDLFIIGGGSGGVRAARWAATRGLRVGIAEGARLGGTCVNVGCVPKKLFFHASHVSSTLRDASGFGWDIPEQSHHWERLQEGIETYITRLNGIYERMLDTTGVDHYQGWASLVDAHTIKVVMHGDATVEVRARHILLAPGGAARLPQISGIEHACTSDHFFALTTRPRSALIVGGGYIGVELAGVLHGLGVETTLAFRGERPLRSFDSDLSARLDAALRADLNVISGVTPQKIERIDHKERGEENSPQTYRVTLASSTSDSSRAPLELEVDLVLFATGRVPNTHRLNLDAVEIARTQQGAICVDDEYRTNIPHIFAVGDVIDKIQLTPVALAEAMRVVGTLCGEPLPALNYDLVPTTVFSHPNLGTVGLSEDEARARGLAIVIYEADFKPLHQALTAHPRRVYMKIVVDADNDRILGFHMIGDEAGEQIQGLAAALQAGITKRELDQTIGIHPTMAEEWVTMRTPRA